MNRKETTTLLTEAASHYFIRKIYSVHEEFGVERRGRKRLDLLCMNMKREFVGVEVKSCRADYISDKKWHTYLPYVNKLYFMLPPKAIKSKFFDKVVEDTKPLGVGIMSISDNGYVYIVQNAKRRDLDDIVAMTHLTKMAWRNGNSCKNVSRRKKRFGV